MRRGLLITAGWVTAVATATVLGFTAVSSLGDEFPGRPLSRQEVEDRLAQTTPTAQPSSSPSSSAVASPTASPSASSARRHFTGSGGSLWATCRNGLASVEGITPKTGFRLDESQRGPARTAWVKFKQDGGGHGRGQEFLVSVTCDGSTATVTETKDD
ncbi:hypothetical protein AB0M47_01785 [Hamadaea sp. NPDC051192]|uniref:hypothetical protein n=1 Tax=Hamadaea sp. NPDC051192 TaxID=3154940 RepID=UPI00341DE8BC